MVIILKIRRHVSVQSNHYQAKYKTQYWYIQRVFTIRDPILFTNCIRHYRSYFVLLADVFKIYIKNILIRSNEMQHYAGVYLLQKYSTCFECLSHSSSGVHQTTAKTFHQRALIRPRWWKVVALIRDMTCTRSRSYNWCTPDDGWDRHPKHVE